MTALPSGQGWPTISRQDRLPGAKILNPLDHRFHPGDSRLAFSLDTIVPWGRAYAEYQAMFSLGPADLARPILGCGDGPASFNAVATASGRQVISIDPLYAFSAARIKDRIAKTRDTVLEQLRRNLDAYVWTHIRSVEDLDRLRAGAMTAFLDDYASGRRQGRYLAGALPDLPFADRQFGLALASHLLFLYSDQLSLDFHLQALRQMLRVADEVRVFPLLTLAGEVSPHLAPVLASLAAQGYAVQIEAVDYEFQRGGNRMLRITPA